MSVTAAALNSTQQCPLCWCLEVQMWTVRRSYENTKSSSGAPNAVLLWLFLLFILWVLFFIKGLSSFFSFQVHPEHGTLKIKLKVKCRPTIRSVTTDKKMWREATVYTAFLFHGSLCFQLCNRWSEHAEQTADCWCSNSYLNNMNKINNECVSLQRDNKQSEYTEEQ